MDYEKEYKAALERCREFYAKLGNKQLKEEVEDIFPELKIEESEDERTRKALITFFQRFPYERIDDAGTNVNEAIAWLEKQNNLIIELKETYAEIGRLVKENYYLKEKQDEHKSVEWSRVDNTIVEGICLALEYSNESGKTIEKYENWLHSIKERMKGE